MPVAKGSSASAKASCASPLYPHSLCPDSCPSPITPRLSASSSPWPLVPCADTKPLLSCSALHLGAWSRLLQQPAPPLTSSAASPGSQLQPSQLLVLRAGAMGAVHSTVLHPALRAIACGCLCFKQSTNQLQSLLLPGKAGRSPAQGCMSRGWCGQRGDAGRGLCGAVVLPGLLEPGQRLLCGSSHWGGGNGIHGRFPHAGRRGLASPTHPEPLCPSWRYPLPPAQGWMVPHGVRGWRWEVPLGQGRGCQLPSRTRSLQQRHEGGGCRGRAGCAHPSGPLPRSTSGWPEGPRVPSCSQVSPPNSSMCCECTRCPRLQ